MNSFVDTDRNGYELTVRHRPTASRPHLLREAYALEDLRELLIVPHVRASNGKLNFIEFCIRVYVSSCVRFRCIHPILRRVWQSC
jgi:hypothetical protein